jgi:hypothetical protein
MPASSGHHHRPPRARKVHGADWRLREGNRKTGKSWMTEQAREWRRRREQRRQLHAKAKKLRARARQRIEPTEQERERRRQRGAGRKA